MITKINSKRELQNIAINQSANIDYQDFMNIYRECTKKPYNFFDNRYYVTSEWSFRFRKNLFDSYKNDNNWSDEAQYDLDRKAAKISALSCNNLDKCEYLTGEDLGLKPSTVEEAKFEYSPLGKIFNKGLS